MKRLTAFLLAIMVAFTLTVNVALPALASNTPERVNVSVANLTWSLNTLDGQTINQNTYADKTVLFVFYDATLLADGTGSCYYSSTLISQLAAAGWVGNDKIKVVAVDGNDNSAQTVAQYKNTYAPSNSDIVFALNGSKLMWQLLDANYLSFAFCAVVQNKTITYRWDGCYSAGDCKEAVIKTIGDDLAVERTVDLGVSKRSKEEIQAFVKSHSADLDQSITYAAEPSLSGTYAPGVLSAETENSALNLLNQVRYIAGLSADITLDTSKSQAVSAATLLNHLNHTMTHYPTRPDELADSAYDSLYELGYQAASASNIAMGYTSLNRALINGWMADEDSSNIDRVGHRRWLLSPSMKTTGFGATGIQSAVYVGDSYWQGYSTTYVAWPAQVMPIEYFQSNYPWSLSLGYQIDPAGVTVTLVRQSDSRTWKFSKGSANGDFYVNTGGYGSPACIIFRPDGLNTISSDDLFDVNIRIADGSEITNISYQVDFFGLSEEEAGLRGDVDSDGAVTAQDALAILRMVVGLEGKTAVADLDGDHEVTAQDALMVLRIVVGLDKF